MTDQDWLLRQAQEHYDGAHFDGKQWVDRYGVPLKTSKWRDIKAEADRRRKQKP